MIDINSILEDRKKSWSIAALIALCVVAFVLLGQYDFGNFRKIKLAISESKHNKVTLDSISEYKTYLKEFNAHLAPAGGIDWFMEAITAIAKNNDVALSAVKPLDTERSTGYSIVKVSIEGVTSYKSLLRLVAALEDSKEYMFIQDISMRSVEAGTGRSAKASTESLPSDRSVAFKAIIASVVREI